MTASEPVQDPRAWMTRLRDEAVRMRRPEVAKIVHVGWAIASYTDADGTPACPSTQEIAAIVGSDEDTVTRAKKVLTALGVLAVRRRPNTNSQYLLLSPPGEALDWDEHLHLYTDTRQARRKRRIKEQQLAAQPTAPAAGRAADQAPVPAVGTQGAAELVQGESGRPADNQPSRTAPEPGPALTSVPGRPGAQRKTPVTHAPTQPPLLLAVQEQEPPGQDEVRRLIAERGVAAAMRRFGRNRVARELAAPTPGATPAHGVLAELAVACRYCEAPVDALCHSSEGPRGTAHQARLDDWATTHARCPDCTAPPGQPCSRPDGSTHTGIHAPRADLGAEMRRAADGLIETGT